MRRLAGACGSRYIEDDMTGTVAPETLERIKAVVGPRGWIGDPAGIAPYLEEQRGRYDGATPLVVRPASTAEVASVVRVCAETGTPIVPQGGNTGLCGGAVAGVAASEILLNLGRLNAIRSVDPLGDTLTAEAGCILADVQAAAAAVGRLFPLSLAAQGTSHIGGNLSTNAGGTQVLRYGTARALVLGLEVVLPDGRVWGGLRGLRKDNTGYDLKQLFIGAEGTLGIITAAVLKLFATPRESVTALIAVRDPATGLELLQRVRAALGEIVSAWELLPRIGFDFTLAHIPEVVDPLDEPSPWYVLAELASGSAGGGARRGLEAVLGEALDERLAADAVIAASEAQANALWRPRESLPEAEKREGGGLKHDVSVPLGQVAAFIDRADEAVRREVEGVRVVAFGHLGDGNIHFNLSPPPGSDATALARHGGRLTRIIHDIAVSLGGSISAEHGVGLLKREEIRRYKPAVEIDLMRTLKSALDPHNIMNPGKVV